MSWRIQTLARQYTRHIRCRGFSTATTTSEADVANAATRPGPQVFISTCTDPYLNLALEDYLFQRMPVDEDQPVSDRLLFYVNDACVVVGRNQNPWRECNLPLLASLGIPLVRRRSGGGTVVHDSGNVNFSFMTQRNRFSRDGFAKVVVESVNGIPERVEKTLRAGTGTTTDDDPLEELFGAPAAGVGLPDVEVSGSGLKIVVDGPKTQLELNARHDIVSADTKEKVSGSAYKIARQKAYHHGTMLLNAKLDVLRALLFKQGTDLGVVEGRGVESVKSPVANVGLDRDVFIDAVVAGFLNQYPNEHETDDNPLTAGLFDSPSEQSVLYIQPEHIPAEAREDAQGTLDTWKWKYAQTPDFTHTLPVPAEFGFDDDYRVRFTVSKGLLKDVEVLDADVVDAGLDRLRTHVRESESVAYSSEEIARFLGPGPVREAVLRALA